MHGIEDVGLSAADSSADIGKHCRTAGSVRAHPFRRNHTRDRVQNVHEFGRYQNDAGRGRDAFRNVRVIGDTANFINDADVTVRILSIIAGCSRLGVLTPIAVFAILAVILVFGERFQQFFDFAIGCAADSDNVHALNLAIADSLAQFRVMLSGQFQSIWARGLFFSTFISVPPQN